MGRNFLKGTHGDAANAVLAAAGYNFRRLLGLARRPLACLPHRLARRRHERPPRRPLTSVNRAGVANAAYFTVDGNAGGSPRRFTAGEKGRAQRVVSAEPKIFDAAPVYSAAAARFGSTQFGRT
jgi:hypothetical protein